MNLRIYPSYFTVKKIIPFILSTMLILGCASPEKIRQDYVKVNPDLSGRTKKAILEGRIFNGMNINEVRATLGGLLSIDSESVSPNLIFPGTSNIKYASSYIMGADSGRPCTLHMIFINNELSNYSCDYGSSAY